MADEPLGFIQTLQDVKTLILFVLSRLTKPVSMTTLYELCFQDDRLSYFDFAVALPQLMESGHICCEQSEYSITDQGRADGAIMEIDIPRSIRERCQSAITRYQTDMRRAETSTCEIVARGDGLYTVVMSQNSSVGQIMRLELMSPNLNHARIVERAWNRNADNVLRAMMEALMSGEQKL